MRWRERISPIKVDDTVAYSKQFLQSIGQYTGRGPQARGKVTGLKSLGEVVVAEVE